MSLMHSIVWLNQKWMAPWCHKIKIKTLIGLVLNKMPKSNQVINWKKVKKTNNKDSVISKTMNLNTCHNLKFQPKNKKSNQLIMKQNKAHQRLVHYKKNCNHKLVLSLCKKFFQVTFYWQAREEERNKDKESKKMRNKITMPFFNSYQVQLRSQKHH